MPAKMMMPEPDRLQFKAFTNANTQQNKMLKSLIGGAVYSKTKNPDMMRMSMDAPPQFPIKDQTVEDIAEAAVGKRLALENIRSFQRSALGAVQQAVGGPAQTGFVGPDLKTAVGLRGSAMPMEAPEQVQYGLPGSLRARAGMAQPQPAMAEPRPIFGAGAAQAQARPIDIGAATQRVQRVREVLERRRQQAMGGAEERKENLPERAPAQAIPVAIERDEAPGILGDPGGTFRGVGPANPNDMAQHATNTAPPMPPPIMTQAQQFMAQAREDGVPPGVTVEQAAGMDAANQNEPGSGYMGPNPQSTDAPPMAGGYDAEDVPTTSPVVTRTVTMPDGSKVRLTGTLREILIQKQELNAIFPEEALEQGQGVGLGFQEQRRRRLPVNRVTGELPTGVRRKRSLMETMSSTSSILGPQESVRKRMGRLQPMTIPSTVGLAAPAAFSIEEPRRYQTGTVVLTEPAAAMRQGFPMVDIAPRSLARQIELQQRPQEARFQTEVRSRQQGVTQRQRARRATMTSDLGTSESTRGALNERDE